MKLVNFVSQPIQMQLLKEYMQPLYVEVPKWMIIRFPSGIAGASLTVTSGTSVTSLLVQENMERVEMVRIRAKPGIECFFITVLFLMMNRRICVEFLRYPTGADFVTLFRIKKSVPFAHRFSHCMQSQYGQANRQSGRQADPPELGAAAGVLQQATPGGAHEVVVAITEKG